MSVTEWVNMNGYGIYVWSSFGMAAVLIVSELISLKYTRKNVIKEIRKTAQLTQERHESQT